MGEQGHEMSRRAILRGAAVTAVGAPLVAACGADDGGGEGAGQSPSGSGGVTVPTSDVPVGGGTVLAEEKIVVTQPAEGEYKAFSAVCTHQGCPVESVSDGRINCPCHGSQFSIEDGSVVTGPATRSLETLKASAQGDTVTVA